MDVLVRLRFENLLELTLDTLMTPAPELVSRSLRLEVAETIVVVIVGVVVFGGGEKDCVDALHQVGGEHLWGDGFIDVGS